MREASEALKTLSIEITPPDVQRRRSALMRPVHNKLDGHYQDH